MSGFLKDRVQLQISYYIFLKITVVNLIWTSIIFYSNTKLSCMHLDHSLSLFHSWRRRNIAFDSWGERSGENPYKAGSFLIEHWSLSPAQWISHHPECHSSCIQLMDAHAEESPPQAVTVRLPSWPLALLVVPDMESNPVITAAWGRGCSLVPLTFHQQLGL